MAKARYTIITMDTNVATLILDGKAFSSRLRNAMATLPALATAVAVVLMHDFGEILRVRSSELAHRWLAATRPLIYSEIDMSWLQRYFEFVDAAANEMGKMPTLCEIIVQALKSYPQLVVGKKLEVISFGITFVLTNLGGGGGEVLRW